MKRLILSIITAILAIAAAWAHEFNNESLDYKVMFKWGLVNKQAGHVTLKLHDTGDRYVNKLTAASEAWADRFYKVRDTLNGEIIKATFSPVFYEKIAHEGGESKHDVVRYSRSGAKTIGHCTRKVVKKGKTTKEETRTLESTGTTVDMLTAFYYMRRLPFEDWQKGHVVTITIFSGKRKELLTIKYIGTDKVEYDKKSYNCHHISFIFTSDGKTKTSDDMDAWITDDSRRIPVKLEGKLKVGKVRCFYTGK